MDDETRAMIEQTKKLIDDRVQEILGEYHHQITADEKRQVALAVFFDELSKVKQE